MSLLSISTTSYRSDENYNKESLDILDKTPFKSSVTLICS